MLEKLPEQWQPIFCDLDEDDDLDGDEPYLIRKNGKFWFYLTVEEQDLTDDLAYLIVYDESLNIAKKIEVSGADDMTLKMIQATAILTDEKPIHKQLSF